MWGRTTAPTSGSTFRVTWPLARRGIEQRLIRLARVDRLLPPIVPVQDQPFRTVVAELGLVLALDDRERLHDVLNVISLHTVQVKERTIQLGAQQRPPLVVPRKRRTSVTHLTCKRLHIP